MFDLNWTMIKSALVSGVLMALLAISTQIIQTGNVFVMDWTSLANVGVLAFLTSFVSLVKSLLTTSSGNFAGFVGVRD